MVGVACRCLVKLKSSTLKNLNSKKLFFSPLCRFTQRSGLQNEKIANLSYNNVESSFGLSSNFANPNQTLNNNSESVINNNQAHNNGSISSHNSNNNGESDALDRSLSMGFIGAGQMAQAFIKGLLRANAIQADQIWLSNPTESKLNKLAARGVHVTTDNIQVCQKSEVIFLAVKPAVLPQVLNQIKNHITPNHLIVSIAAGVSINSIESLLPVWCRVIRVMPNTPALVGAMAAGHALGSNSTKQDGDLINKILSPLGKSMLVSEMWLNAVTGLAGSGPAYVFMMIEALADGGVRAGLSRDVAMTLATQTVYGSAKMLLDTGKHPGSLKDQVASPGGTTIAGIHALEHGAFRGVIMDAVYTASNRAAELANAATLVSNYSKISATQVNLSTNNSNSLPLNSSQSPQVQSHIQVQTSNPQSQVHGQAQLPQSRSTSSIHLKDN